jgi:hypothetical protein
MLTATVNQTGITHPESAADDLAAAPSYQQTQEIRLAQDDGPRRRHWPPRPDHRPPLIPYGTADTAIPIAKTKALPDGLAGPTLGHEAPLALSDQTHAQPPIGAAWLVSASFPPIAQIRLFCAGQDCTECHLQMLWLLRCKVIEHAAAAQRHLMLQLLAVDVVGSMF